MAVAQKRKVVKKKLPVAPPVMSVKKPVVKKKKTLLKAVAPTLAEKYNELPVETAKQTHTCASCHVLPLGAVELVAILLSLVFSLTAVLLTSTVTIADQQKVIEQYESLVQR